MTKKDGYDYRVERVDEIQLDETQPDEIQEQIEMQPVPMEEINEGGVMVAFFILICAVGFTVYLFQRIFLGGGSIGSRIACVALAAIVVLAVLGMISTTIAKYRGDGNRKQLALALLVYAAAIAIGVAVGCSMGALV